MTAWAAGMCLGPYELLSPIGSGGMGEVWRARDTRLDRTVAIKRVKGQHNARFEQEARAIAALNHPHICHLYDVGPEYLVLEYVEGKPLRGPLPALEAVLLAIQVVSALEEAHGRGILHRDLKPANILVTQKGSTKLLDFGLAKLMVESDTDVTKTIEGTVLGTAAYMAPEQAEGKPLDERSDVFSFGAVLYEMLSGNRAFLGSSTAAVLSAVLRDDPAPLQASPALERVVARCLRKTPSERFRSMAEVRNALETVLSRPVSESASIAVLPFANMSRDPDDEYFSDGLAEEIINALTQIRGLKVIARTSAFAFKGKNEDIRKIAETLGVTTILEGSVRRAANHIRIAAQLISASDGSHLWSERYDREMADVFAIQDEIAQAIAAALQIKLSGPRVGSRPYTPKLPAYEAYLKARHHFDQLTKESAARGRQYLEQAIQLDRDYALPHNQLGEYFLTLASIGVLSAHEAMPLVQAAAQKALLIDSSLAEPQALLGIVAGVYHYDWNEAERRFHLAMADDPVAPRVRHWYGQFYLMQIGRAQESLEQQDRALREDPLNPLYRIARITSLARMGQDFASEAREFLETNENHWLPYYALAISYAAQEMWAEAIPFAEKAHSLSPWSVSSGLLAGLLARTGEESRADVILQELGEGKKHGPLGFATFHLLCGDVDAAADSIEMAIEERMPIVGLLLHGPLGKDLRSSPRWPGLMRMMNLPESGPAKAESSK